MSRGEFSQQAALIASKSHQSRRWHTEKQRYFQIGTPHAFILASGPKIGLGQVGKGVFPMTFTSIRETATIFAGAFISALLLVSAATSLPIA